MSYVPQPIPIYVAPELQHFRKGSCKPYENRVLANGNSYRFTNLMIKRPTSGATATVELYTIADVLIGTVTAGTQTSYPLDGDLDETEMLVIGAGNWTTGASIPSGFYYLKIDDGSFTWYSDEIYIDQVAGADFPNCNDGFVKLTWIDGRNIVTGKGSDGITPILAYPDTSHTFFTYLQANLSQPTWEQEETGEADAYGQVVIETKTAMKRWRLEGFPVYEGIIDALNASALFETVTIEFPTLPAFEGVKDVRVEFNWENGGCMALYQYDFTVNYMHKLCNF